MLLVMLSVCCAQAFYMRMNDPGTDSAPGDTVAAMDILVPGVRRITRAQSTSCLRNHSDTQFPDADTKLKHDMRGGICVGWGAGRRKCA